MEPPEETHVLGPAGVSGQSQHEFRRKGLYALDALGGTEFLSDGVYEEEIMSIAAEDPRLDQEIQGVPAITTLGRRRTVAISKPSPRSRWIE
jgi:hypothetical protein